MRAAVSNRQHCSVQLRSLFSAPRLVASRPQCTELFSVHHSCSAHPPTYSTPTLLQQKAEHLTRPHGTAQRSTAEHSTRRQFDRCSSSQLHAHLRIALLSLLLSFLSVARRISVPSGMNLVSSSHTTPIYARIILLRRIMSRIPVSSPLLCSPFVSMILVAAAARRDANVRLVLAARATRVAKCADIFSPANRPVI